LNAQLADEAEGQPSFLTATDPGVVCGQICEKDRPQAVAQQFHTSICPVYSGAASFGVAGCNESNRESRRLFG
jgi:hypothetical protein